MTDEEAREKANELYARCVQLSQDIMKESDGENRDAIGEDLSDAWDELDAWMKDKSNPMPEAWRS